VLYDALGRAYEGGQLHHATVLTDKTARDPALYAAWLAAATQKEQVTRTYFDAPLNTTTAARSPRDLR
jgi:hypothetical protein